MTVLESGFHFTNSAFQLQDSLSVELESGFQLLLLVAFWINLHVTAVASMRRTEALASVKFYQILSIFIFFIRLIILEDFIRLISYKGPCVRFGCSFFLAMALHVAVFRIPKPRIMDFTTTFQIPRFSKQKFPGFQECGFPYTLPSL